MKTKINFFIFLFFLILISGPAFAQVDEHGNLLNLGKDSKSTAADLSGVSILYFGKNSSEPSWFASMGATTHSITNPNDVTATLLSQYDVFFIGYSAEDQYGSLTPKKTIIQNFIANGGGVILEQPSVTGYTCGFFPSGFAVTVFSTWWKGSSSSMYITAAGQNHPITKGLTTADLSGNFEEVRDSQIGAQWEILVRHSVYTNNVVLLAGEYQNGRLVFFTGNMGSASSKRGSTQYAKNMINWAAGEQGMLQGTVIDALTSLPIEDASVVIVKNDTSQTTTTAANGTYAQTLPQGSWWVVVTKNGYEPSASAVNIQRGQTTILSISLRPHIF
ncbi:MAG: carboxypeptidase regulatory-like domain-containing protein [Candidatus Aminicenantes bacterium]|nr:carboxypeptidase regulatory-like domain-containing protein [Candidatus Aminicenantes bacterium]